MRQPKRLSPHLKLFSTKQKPNGRRHASPRQITALRLSELAKLYAARWGRELPNDDAGRDDLEIAIHHLAALPRPQRRIEQWARLWAPWLTIAELDAIAQPILMRPQCFTADELAWKLRLLAADRDALRLTTIGACDMPKAERKKRRRNREKQRKSNARRAKGSKPRKQYEAESIARAQPWRVEGISRATWYRRQRETGVKP